MNKTEESDKRWEGGGKICLKAYQKSGVTVILFTVRGYSKRANLASTGKITVLSMLCPLKSYRL